MEEKTKKALLWIKEILDRHQIPFQISGGFAAKIYGSPRSLNDIDIDIPEERFAEIIDEIKKYIIFGPEQYADRKWSLYLMTLNYKGQEIDIGGAMNVKIFDANNNEWLPFPADFNKVEWKEIFGIKVPVIPKGELIRYKSYLDGAHQLVDINSIK